MKSLVGIQKGRDGNSLCFTPRPWWGKYFCKGVGTHVRGWSLHYSCSSSSSSPWDTHCVMQRYFWYSLALWDRSKSTCFIWALSSVFHSLDASLRHLRLRVSACLKLKSSQSPQHFIHAADKFRNSRRWNSLCYKKSSLCEKYLIYAIH